MKRSRALVAALVVVGASLVGAVGALGGSSADSAQPPIIIGAANAKTGFVNFFDGPVSAGAELAVRDFNAQGGVLGRQLKIIYSDTKSDLNQTQQAALEVISQGAHFVLTSCDYDYGSPAARVANQRGIVAISCAGGPLYGKQGTGPLTFNVYQATPTEGATIAEYAYNKRKWRSAYALCDVSVEYSKTVCTYFKEAWKNLGGRLVGEDTFQNTDASISSQVTRIKSAPKHDFLVVSSYAPGGPAALRQIRGAGIESPIFGAAAFDGTYWFPAVPNLRNFFYPGPASKWGSPIRNPLVGRIVKQLGAQPPSYLYPLSGYAAVETLVVAMRRAKTTNGAKVAAEIEKFKDEVLVLGKTTYTKDCHIPLGRAMAVMTVANNKDIFLGLVKPKVMPKAPC
jgi:branched-chain amino acid transport system substrate-binding protein